MDEASRLVADLHTKLAELNHKVWQYRCDLAGDFEKFREDLLRNVDRNVSEKVARTLQESMKEYRALFPDDRPDSLGAAGNDRVNNGSGASLPVPTPNRCMDENTRKMGSSRSPPRKQHAREEEFRGLFTPTYLPLLDSNSPRRESSDSSAILSPDIKGKGVEMDPLHVDASTEVGKSLVSSPITPFRPSNPQRRNTDGSTSSDISDVPRRSALRRSSSASKGGSPRRVRFDVEGQVVLPTSEPLPGAVLEEELATPAFPSDDEEDEGTFQMIEDVDSPPRPKRISSTQRLRMLSRTSQDEEGVSWTTVTAPPDGSASVATSNDKTAPASDDDEDEEEELSIATQMKSDGPALPKSPNSPRTTSLKSRTPKALRSPPPKSPETNLSSDSSPTLDMAPPHRRSQNATNTTYSKSPTASTRSPGVDLLTATRSSEVGEDDAKLQDFDEDEMFTFDETDPATTPSRPQYHAEEESSDSEDEGLSISPIKSRGKAPSDKQNVHSATGSKPIGINSYSRSPLSDSMITTGRTEQKKENTPQMQDRQDNATGSDMRLPVTGSYRNYPSHPFSAPIVDPEMHRRAETLGELDSFVGSVDGRSGVDESDSRSWATSGNSHLNSLRGGGGVTIGSARGNAGGGAGSVGGGSGMRYGSLGERMMLEERMEEQKKTSKESGSGAGTSLKKKK